MDVVKLKLKANEYLNIVQYEPMLSVVGPWTPWDGDAR